MFFIIEKKEGTTLDFSQNSVVVVWYVKKWKLKRL